MFLSFILMNMENFCKGGGDGFRRFNGFYGFNGVGAAHNTMEAPRSKIERCPKVVFKSPVTSH